MTIKFHTEEETEGLYFRDVEEDQFFIDSSGTLCVKHGNYGYVSLTSHSGVPMVTIEEGVSGATKVQKILPRVTKITWE
jgi:hypothetical protein